MARALLESPDTPSKELFRRARERYDALGELTVQQFHGRYVLSVRRELKRRPAPKPRLPATAVTPDPSSDPPRPTGPLKKGSLLERLAGAGSSGPETDEAVSASGRSYRAAVRPRPAEPETDGAEDTKEGVEKERTEPLRRSSAPEAPTPTPPAPTPSAPKVSLVEKAKRQDADEPDDARAATRTLFHQFALEVEMAASLSDLVDVVAGVDRYVDRAMAINRRPS